MQQIIAANDYTLDYVLRTPNPKWPDTEENPDIWAKAIFTYLRRIGIKNPETLNRNWKLSEILEDQRPNFKYPSVKELMLWPEIKRIFNIYIQRKNRKRSAESLERKQHMGLIKKQLTLKPSSRTLKAELLTELKSMSVGSTTIFKSKD